MNSDLDFQITFDCARSKPVVVEPSAGQISSDAGLLPFHQLDEQLGLTRQFAEALTDPRHQSYVDHTFLDMTRMRVYGILADYPDQNDHDVLRSDPIFKLICDRSIHDEDLASQPTSATGMAWRAHPLPRRQWLGSAESLQRVRAAGCRVINRHRHECTAEETERSAAGGSGFSV
jgi:hypothetical protein